MHRGLSLAIGIAAGSAFLAGCSDDKPETIAVEASEPGSGQFKITAPASVSGGVVKVEFKNSGELPHEAQLVRVEGDHSQDEVLAIASGDSGEIPDWFLLEGGVGNTGPGQSKAATLNLSPGNYFVIDTGSDENENSFAAKGAITAMTVTGASSEKVPASGARIEARDYEFTIPDLEAGDQEITFDNVGNQPHLFVAAPIAPGKTIGDVAAAFESIDDESSGPPPVDFEKATSVAAIEGKKAMATTLSLEKGNYAFICFLTDRGGGAPHFTLGMLQEGVVS